MITANDKIAAIRDHGFRVLISHRRQVRKHTGSIGMNRIYSLDRMTAAAARAGGWEIDTNGGETIVTVLVGDMDPPHPAIQIAQGRADCSLADRFEKRVGLELAVRRAIAGAPELRAVIGKLTQVSEYDRMVSAVADRQPIYAETLVGLLEDAIADAEVHGLDVLDALASSGLALMPFPGAASIAYQKSLQKRPS